MTVKRSQFAFWASLLGAAVVAVLIQGIGRASSNATGPRQASNANVTARNEAIRREIDLLNRKNVEAFRRKDVPAIASGYTSDARLMPPNGPIAQGYNAIAHVWSQLLALPNVKLNWSATYVDVARSGELAYEIGTYSMLYDGATGPVSDHGKYIVVWKKQGRLWKTAADIFNTDMPVS